MKGSGVWDMPASPRCSATSSIADGAPVVQAIFDPEGNQVVRFVRAALVAERTLSTDDAALLETIRRYYQMVRGGVPIESEEVIDLGVLSEATGRTILELRLALMRQRAARRIV